MVPYQNSMVEEEEEDVPHQNPRFFGAVHVGVGFHMQPNEKALRSAMKRACLAAASVLRKGPGGCIDAVSAAIQVLEVSGMVSNCCFVGQGTNVGVNTAGSNTSHLLGW